MDIRPQYLGGNFDEGRKGWHPDLIVNHIMVGTMEGTFQHFSRYKPRDPVSAHYGISLEGEVVQYVRDEDTAWANGRVLRPMAELVKDRPGINPNLYSLSIEHEGYPHIPPTRAQMYASAELHRALSVKHNIPLTRRHVVGHREIFAEKSCPGLIDVDLILQLAAAEPTVVVVRRPMPPVHQVPNLEKIQVPKPEDIELIARMNGWSNIDIEKGIKVVERLGRAILRADESDLKPLIDALADWIKSR